MKKESERPVTAQKIKEVPKQEKEQEPVVKKEESKDPVVSNGKATWIFIAACWLAVVVMLIFRLADPAPPFYAFKKVTLPLGLIGAALILYRWNKSSVSEQLLYAHGLFICLLPVIATSVDSNERSGLAVLLFLLFNAGYSALLMKKVKEFQLADMIISSVEVFYLCFIFFSMIFYIAFRSAYGGNDTASSIGLIVGAIVGTGGIVFMRNKWIQARRR
jgi:hypothetical protein